MMFVLVDSVGSTDHHKEVCSVTSRSNETNCDGQTQKDWVSVSIIFIGIFTVGIGSTGIFSFGIPYVDDNTEKSKSPLALGFVMAGRILGPTLGYILGSFTLRIFVNPGQEHGGKFILSIKRKVFGHNIRYWNSVLHMFFYSTQKSLMYRS